jgi:hypothetical protein
MVAAAIASLLNPFGMEALLQPLQYFTVWRHEPVYRSIGELSPLYQHWDAHVRDLLPLWMGMIVAGAFVRWRARGFDAAEAVLLVVCLTQAMTTHRFLGYAALTLAPFAARDMADWLGRVRWPAGLREPRARASLAASACVLLAMPVLADPAGGLGLGWAHVDFPEHACDWIEAHQVRGRAFNVFGQGGYLLYRFYPDPGRLPFMDIHQAGTEKIRYVYALAQGDSAAWHVADRYFRFDWVLLPGAVAGSPALADILDADTTWALVFADDEAVLWLRRNGSCAQQARESAYRFLPGGTAGVGALGEWAERDSTLRGPIRAEIDRAIASSPYNTGSRLLAGDLDLLEGHFFDACRHLDEAARQRPLDTHVRDRQGLAHLYAGDLAGAARAFRAADRAPGAYAEADLRAGQLLAARGRRDEARRAYERSLARHPDLTEARDSLEAMGTSRR